MAFGEGKSDKKNPVNILDLSWTLRDLITGEASNKIPRSKILIKV